MSAMLGITDAAYDRVMAFRAGSAVVVESDLFMVWTFDKARAVEMRMFFDRDQALRALGSD